jgi:hypothetical protein
MSEQHVPPAEAPLIQADCPIEMADHPRVKAILFDARRAPDGHWYIRDLKRPGKYLQVVRRQPQ